MMNMEFAFYGLLIRVSCESRTLLDQVLRDFTYFKAAEKGRQRHVNIRIHLEHPPYDTLPSLKAAFFTPRNVCYELKKTTYIDYFGKALVIYDRLHEKCRIYGTDPDLVHEIIYLFFLSTVGRYLDSRRIHRIHALGVSCRERGVLLLLPSGGGKSTMALNLLRNEDFLLLSEDTPLIDRQGRILPFPLRIGVRPETDTGIPGEYLRTVRRMEFDPKTLIDIEYFKDRIGTAVMPGAILIGERNLGTAAAITEISPGAAFQSILKYMIVGLGIYQGLEFLLERGPLELINRSGVVASRGLNGIRLLSRSRAYRFVMGRDIDKNYQTFLDFIQKAPL